ncbi:PREDICTED: dipeptidyl peptidase 4-like [Amphimedon queenslandica]|nr:PREDICTED: dipeptidyl peptidase 4-like [Amphimedon queenslandica]|eukprot:XP_019863802.1 PREDICTED: dipeptidyl peptidase 4-like [Amphimedon queenslandica]
MAGMIESSGTGVFTAAISQSPVSDWHYYDSIYTERYMNQPTDNSDGYRVTSLLTRLSNVSVESLPHYLLIHGTGDDNVHFQNTAQLISVLTEREIQYQLMVYTDQDHSLSGGKTRNHLYQLITDFLNFHSFKLSNNQS